MFSAQSNQTEAYSVPMHIHGESINMLLDTGAAMSILKADLIPKNLISGTSIRAVGPSGESIDIVGQATLPVSSGNFTAHHNFLLAKGLGNKGLLGADFVKAHKVENINIRDSIIELKGNRRIPFKIISAPQMKASARAITVAETQCIKPFCSGMVKCTVFDKLGVPGMASDSFNKGSNANQGFLIANTVAIPDVQGQIMVPVSNFKTYEKLKLKKGQLIGAFEVIEANNITLKQDPQQSKIVGQLPPVDINEASITADQKRQIEQLLIKYNSVFAKNSSDLGLCTLIEHKIETFGAPVRQALRRTTYEEKQNIEPQIKAMLEADVIAPSTSPWASNLVLVRKRDNTLRTCVDFRALNARTIRDNWPLPRIDESIDALGGAKYFSTIDLMSGYWQLPVFEPHRPKTAIITHMGTFEFKRMPMGLVNSGATFTRVLQSIFHSMCHTEVILYLDDLICFAPTFELHLERLEHVLQRLSAANLKAKPTKTHICKTEVEFLGFLISEKGVRVNPDKIKPIVEWPVPKNVSELRSVLGMFVFYKKFIKNFASIAAPLHAATKKDSKFTWGPDQQAAFECLKEKLTSPPILGFPRFDLPYIIRTDASGTGIGAILNQIQPTTNREGTERRVIAYASRQLTEAERKLAATEREMIGACWAVIHFRPYLKTRYNNGVVILETDANPLTILNQDRDLSPKMGRYKMMMQDYDIKWQYTPGKTIANVDSLSRQPDRRSREEIEAENERYAAEMEEPLDNLLQLNAVEIMPQEQITRPRFIIEQGKDAEIRAIVDNKRTNPKWCERYEISEGLLRRKHDGRTQIIVPKSLQQSIMFICHDQNGHAGTPKSFAKLQERFHWKGYQEDMSQYVASCLQCQRRQPPPKARAPLQSFVAYRPLEIMSWDITGMAQSDKGNRYLLVMLDVFSSFIETYPLRNQESSTIVQCFKDYVFRYGVPLQVHNDNGQNFVAETTKEIMRIFGCKNTHTTPYRSANPVERTHRTIKDMISKLVINQQRKWCEHIHEVKFAINTSVSDAHGYTPWILWYGRPPQLPVDVFLQSSPMPISKDKLVADTQSGLRQVFEVVRERAEKARTYRREYVAQNNDEPQELEVGQMVLMYCPATKKGDSRKLNCPWYGPYCVLGKAGPVNYYVRLMDGSKPARKVHANFLKPLIGEAGIDGFRDITEEPEGPFRPLDPDWLDDPEPQPAPPRQPPERHPGYVHIRAPAPLPMTIEESDEEEQRQDEPPHQPPEVPADLPPPTPPRRNTPNTTPNRTPNPPNLRANPQLLEPVVRLERAIAAGTSNQIENENVSQRPEEWKHLSADRTISLQQPLIGPRERTQHKPE